MSESPCRSCGSPATLVLDLGLVPASDDFPEVSAPEPDDTHPLELFRCSSCTLLQLGPSAVLAPERPTAVDSSTARAHAARSVAAVLSQEHIPPGATVRERDSGHGSSWLPDFHRAGLVSADPQDVAHLVLDVHYLMHEVDLDSVLQGHVASLAPDGVFVCEFFHALPMVSRGLIDTIRHGHYLYLSLTAALPAFERNGLTVTHVEAVEVYGGSLRVTARRSGPGVRVDPSVADMLEVERDSGLGAPDGVAGFARRGREAAAALRERLETLQATGRTVAGYGAPSKASVLLTLAGVDKGLLPFTVDLAPAKANHRIPGVGVPILPVAALIERRPDEVVVLTWDIAEEVAAGLTLLADGTGWDPMLYVPLPEPRETRLSAFVSR